MKTLLSSFLIAFVLTSFQGVAQDNPLFRHLPPDATSIFQINVPVLVSKLPLQELAQKMATAPKGKSDRMMAMMQNPLATGINITQDFFIAETDKGSPDSLGYVTIIVHLADSAKFVAFLTRQEPGLRFFSYPNKGRAAGKDQYGAAWDKDIAVITIVKAPGTGDHMASSKGATAQPAAPKKPAPSHAALAAKKSFAALRGFDGSVYTTDPTFKDGFSDDADMHVWMQQGAGISRLMKAAMHKNPMGGSKDMMKAMAMSRPNTHSLIELRFETGKITVKSRTVYPPDTLAFIQKFGGKPLNTDLIASIPKGNLLGMINFHFDPAAFGDLLDKSHSRAKLDSMMASQGMTTNDIINALRGDLLVAAVSPADNPADSSTGKPKQPSVYIALTINDMPSFMKLAGKMNLMKDPAAAGSGATGDSTSADGNPTLLDKAKMGYTLKNNILVISTSKLNADAWFGNTEKRSTDFIPGLVKDNPFSLMLDLKTVMSFVKSMDKGGSSDEKKKKIMQAMDQLDLFTLAGGAVKDGRVESTFELKLTNTSENSLHTLIRMF
ncbi:MAG TPA: DUF4836 family protein [Puia sp.]|nr:DUF4836 family protein [Puia sp.]